MFCPIFGELKLHFFPLHCSWGISGSCLNERQGFVLVTPASMMWNYILFKGPSFPRSQKAQVPGFPSLAARGPGLCWESGRRTQQLDNFQGAWNSVPSGFPKGKTRVGGSFPELDGNLQPTHRSIIEADLKNIEACTKRYNLPVPL